MAFNTSPRKLQHQYSPPQTSPLRHSSVASTTSTVYSGHTSPSISSQASTLASSSSSTYQEAKAGHKRGLSEAGMAPGRTREHNAHVDPSSSYKSIRESLRPLPQAPNSSPPSYKGVRVSPERSVEDAKQSCTRAQEPTGRTRSLLSQEPILYQQNDHDGPYISDNYALDSAHDSVLEQNGNHHSTFSTPDFAELKKSSTSQLRTLSKLTQGTPDEAFSISSAGPSVVGLHGRRQLKRNDSVRGQGRPLGNRDAGGWAGRNWMDQQRQFLQAYEYLCHIGEAKEWIEDIIHKPIPPIVQLEEALRDGVTLAEIVQALNPDRSIRIFRHPKLQYRHSDNIAVFFRLLAEIELPELFRFELIDLYEKKNIPKVIYCIHALSWLLYRNGMVSFRIGNLVGQLQFEHHELEEMQRGLDKAGVSMPSFSGMGASFGAEPEPEPIQESEEDRIDRELSEGENSVIDLQAQIRGCMTRLHLGETMQKLWDNEHCLIELQSLIRGDWARQISDYRLSMKNFATNLQSATRGFLLRSRQEQLRSEWTSYQTGILGVQTLFRGRKAREQAQTLKSNIRNQQSAVLQLQAAVRGAAKRQTISGQRQQVLNARDNTMLLQATMRGMLVRTSLAQQAAEFEHVIPAIIALQSMLRGSSQRQLFGDLMSRLRAQEPVWRILQSISRGSLTRLRLQRMLQELRRHDDSNTSLQSRSRGFNARQEVERDKAALYCAESSVLSLQAVSRAFMLRRRHTLTLKDIWTQNSAVLELQSRARGHMYRRQQSHMHGRLHETSAKVIQLQGLVRALLVRSEIGDSLAQLDDEEPAVEALQAVARAVLVRATFAEKQRFFRQNMEKVIKVQSFVRARQQGQAYKSLTSGKNPPVGTVKNFVHLLNDSDFDFDEEVEFERLRKTVVQHVRQNELADQYITQLDIKIALLVKNKITLDEVVKHQKHFGGSVGSLLTNSEMSSKDPFDLKALNKNSRKKLEQYQELFFILQTQPQYLARLFKKIREQATPEKESARTKHLVMGLFGYAQKRREEYYLIKLITRSIKEEISSCRTLQDYLRGNFFCNKIFTAYTKSPKDRKYLRDLFGPIITENIIENAECDLESDPMAIYLKTLEDEQLRTGQPSLRRPDIPREEAIRDPETKHLFIAHLQDLRDLVEQTFGALEDLLHKMPYGVRYIAQQMLQHLTSRFQHEDPNYLLQIAGQWIWKSYLQPALMEPDKHGVLDRGISGEQKRNLAEVAKVLGQVASGRLFGKENIFLNPLNSFVSDAIVRFADIWTSLMDVPDAETHFDIDEFNDLYAKTKPTLYIKMADIFAIHHIVVADVAFMCPLQDDLLREVIRELGSAKTNESELMSVGSSSEICLTLNPKLHDVEDPDAEIKALFMETKRCILYIIRVQAAANLMDIMVKPITLDDESRWSNLVRDELSANSRKRGAYSDANTLIDIATLSYSELKRTALENILRLEEYGRLSRNNHYQDILNAIAVDIRTKHRRRVQRARELEGVRLTLDRLNDQAAYLDQQLKTYNDYIEQAMVTLQNKKGKKRFLMPFTKQWDHERELQRSGRVPKFGSFKYSAQELANRGILVAWQGYSDRQWNQLDLTISSNEVGVFSIEGSSGSIAIPGATAQIPLDDLLQAQYNGTQFMEFFGSDKLRVNVNLFLHLIMRKFYKDRDG